MASKALPILSRTDVVRLWFHQQGLAVPRGNARLTVSTLRNHLTKVGALQLDTINVVERAHYLTLWSRFGSFDRDRFDRLIYRDQIGYEYWGHEASILPISHLPLGRRRMRRFPPAAWRSRAWWPIYQTSAASKKRVLSRLKAEGPLETIDFEARKEEFGPSGPPGGSMPLGKEDARSLKLLWHSGRVAITTRRHFRCVYDLSDRVYPEGPTATLQQYEDSWLLQGLSGNGIATERHLTNYFTGPALSAIERKRVIRRNLRSGRVLQARVSDSSAIWYVLPEHLELLAHLSEPRGTTLLCPFDSFLWQRQRAEELLGFRYRIEIYIPAAKRQFGYYVLPILHDGRLVGRIDPKLHRDNRTLEIRSIHWEEGQGKDRCLIKMLRETLHDLQAFTGADAITLPRGNRHLGS